MKNKNLLTEISRIKSIMGIKEEIIYLNESVESECEKTLERAGYKVYSPNEQRSMDSTCAEDEKMKCVSKFFTDNGKEKGSTPGNYNIRKNKGLCYVVWRSEDTIELEDEGGNKKTLPWRTIAFYDNDDIVFIETLDEVHTKEMDFDGAKVNSAILSEDSKVAQVQFKGKYKCENGSITWSNLKAQGYYNFGSFKTLSTDAKVFSVRDINDNSVLRAIQK